MRYKHPWVVVPDGVPTYDGHSSRMTQSVLMATAPNGDMTS